MKVNQFSLYHKNYILIKILYKMVKNFPKEYKYSLGAEIIDLAWQCLDLVISANSLPNDQKRGKISSLSGVFDKLKMRIRMSQEIELISVGQFTHLENNYLLEMGKEIGGWLKWAKRSGGGVTELGALIYNLFGLKPGFAGQNLVWEKIKTQIK